MPPGGLGHGFMPDQRPDDAAMGEQAADNEKTNDDQDNGPGFHKKEPPFKVVRQLIVHNFNYALFLPLVNAPVEPHRGLCTTAPREAFGRRQSIAPIPLFFASAGARRSCDRLILPNIIPRKILL